ncbi:hypothetical protein CHS0354_033392 [Potamilus streckersoni]|uniref:Secreted protein n=1 Tax=Potamilus streckersoni TaxID=2493646 RepID=A0AAE0W0B0_9BIVA|nr:hypothetical protein CHS0354_033392 [Potamilus streckersoni]
MRNIAVLLLIVTMCAAALSSDPHEHPGHTDQDPDQDHLQTLLQAIDAGNVDVNELLNKRKNNPSRRLWFPLRVRVDWDTGKK